MKRNEETKKSGSAAALLRRNASTTLTEVLPYTILRFYCIILTLRHSEGNYQVDRVTL